MGTSIYENALQDLGSTRSEWAQFLIWLESIDGRAEFPSIRGKKLAENLTRECHLCRDGAFGATGCLVEFMKRCAACMQYAGDDLRLAAFMQAMKDFELCGLGVMADKIPSRMLRYSINQKNIEQLLQVLLGSEARRKFALGIMPAVQALQRLSARWNPAAIPVTLSMIDSGPVWATFDYGQPAPRHDAPSLAIALALPCTTWTLYPGTFLYELEYELAKVNDARFPTVADASTFHLFCPAPDLAPDEAHPETLCGWTSPTDGSDAQPEIVHQNATLRVLSSAPRFVGNLA